MNSYYCIMKLSVWNILRARGGVKTDGTTDGTQSNSGTKDSPLFEVYSTQLFSFFLVSYTHPPLLTNVWPSNTHFPLKLLIWHNLARIIEILYKVQPRIGSVKFKNTEVNTKSWKYNGLHLNMYRFENHNPKA